MTLLCVMVREDRAWKLDLPQTMDRLLGGSMLQAVEQVAAAMAPLQWSWSTVRSSLPCFSNSNSA